MCCSYWGVNTTGTWAADGRVYTKEACTSTGGVYMHHSTGVWAAPEDVWTTVAGAALVLYYTTSACAALGTVYTLCLGFTWTCLHYTWSCLDNSSLHVLLSDLSIYTTNSCTAHGRVSSTGALSAPGRVHTTESCAAPRCVYCLLCRSLSCTRTCLQFRFWASTVDFT